MFMMNVRGNCCVENAKIVRRACDRQENGMTNVNEQRRQQQQQARTTISQSTHVLRLGLTPFLHGSEIDSSGKSKRIEVSNGGEAAGKTPGEGGFIGDPSVEGVDGGGNASLLGRGEGGGGAEDGGEDGELHFVKKVGR